MKKNNYYRCYSNELKEKLMKENQEYILIARDIKTNNTFWLFEINETVKRVISNFNN